MGGMPPPGQGGMPPAPRGEAVGPLSRAVNRGADAQELGLGSVVPAPTVDPADQARALLPDEAQDLAAHVALARLAVGHETLAGRDDGDTQPTEDPAV